MTGCSLNPTFTHYIFNIYIYIREAIKYIYYIFMTVWIYAEEFINPTCVSTLEALCICTYLYDSMTIEFIYVFNINLYVYAYRHMRIFYRKSPRKQSSVKDRARTCDNGTTFIGTYRFIYYIYFLRVVVITFRS